MTWKSRGDLSDAQWAYCEHCNRDVEVAPTFGRLIPHITHAGPAYAERPCVGSSRVPTQRPAEGNEDGSTETGDVRERSALL